jgi:hypothetical protein
MSINTVSTAAVIVSNNNAAKATTIAAAISTGDLRALAVAIRPAGEFARVSCPSSLEFGDTDLQFHARRLAALRLDYLADVDGLSHKAESFEQAKIRLLRDARRGDGKEISKVHNKCTELRTLAAVKAAKADKITAVTTVLTEELTLRQQDRAAYAAKVAEEKAAWVAVMEAAASVPLPAKWLRKQPRVKKVAVRRDDIKVGSFEELAAILS